MSCIIQLYNSYRLQLPFPSSKICRNCSRPCSALLPRNIRHNLLMINSIPESDSKVEKGIQKRIREKVWLQPQINKLGMLRIVVVFLCFDQGIWYRHSLHFEPEFLAGLCNKTGEFVYRELLRELVVNSEFSVFCWIGNGKLYTLNCVSNIKIATSLHE